MHHQTTAAHPAKARFNPYIRRNIRACGFVLLTWMSFAAQASNSQDCYLNKLKAIAAIQGRGNEQLLVLIRQSSDSLADTWSPVLARELARVYNLLLDANQNYFLVELIESVARKRPEEFNPVLDKALSEKNRIEYQKMLEMEKHVNRYGNG